MGTNRIDASMLQKMFLAGAKSLEVKKEWINELNVFPVPDGDTGTNMSLTIMAAAKEVAALEKPTMEALAKAISSARIDTLSSLIRTASRGRCGRTKAEALKNAAKNSIGTHSLAMELKLQMLFERIHLYTKQIGALETEIFFYLTLTLRR